MENTAKPSSSWLDRPLSSVLTITWETVLLAGIILLAVFSRFYDLEARVMSHDETIHVYHNSWSLYTGQGYRHDPLSHGPFQTHVVALSYFLFGDSDLSARIPAVLFSIATVGFIWSYRRYLGKAGTLAAMVMMLISPYMLFYGRYVRNEAFAAFAGVVLIWAVLRYLETGQAKYTYWVTFATVLHFTAKETAFIYTAQALIFLAFFLVYRLTQYEWLDRSRRSAFLVAMGVGVLILVGAELLLLEHSWATTASATQTAAPAIPGQISSESAGAGISPFAYGVIGLGVVALLIAGYFLIKGFGWQRLRQERTFGLIILLTSLVLPMLAAFPVYFVGWNVPTNAGEVSALSNLDIMHIAIFLVPLSILGVILGLLWNPRVWLINAAFFYGFFTIFYTTVFTNGAGFFTGLVGSLGYWLKQQGVQRGSQPWYYYLFVQIPVYEYLPALTSMIAYILLVFGKRPLLRFTQAFKEYQEQKTKAIQKDPVAIQALSDSSVDELKRLENRYENRLAGDGELQPAPVLALLGFWVISGILAFTAAGEKMPWLTVHLTWPMVLFGGWAVGYLVDQTDWSYFRKLRGWLVLLVLVVFVLSFLASMASLLGANTPFQGMSLEQLTATSTFVTSLVVAVVSGYVLYRLTVNWPLGQFLRIVLLSGLFGLGVLTARTAMQASYINYDHANELLVYAHSADGVKEVMRQVDEISRRTSDGNDLIVGFDGEYPFWWYLRNYRNQRYYGANPTRSLRDAPVIIAGSANFGKIEPVVAQQYDVFEYIRLWWPNQDYFNLTWERILYALRDPNMRAALFEIWLNRDYTLYGQVTGKDMSLENWSPAERMRLYIRKDITSKLWNYGAAAVESEILADPYEGKQVMLSADLVFGSPGTELGQLQRPRDLAYAPDGTLYVADTDNHRIQHFTAQGEPLGAWGSFADVTQAQAPGGTFNQPWGIGVGPDGSVFVADTWNHRVQKFNAQGEFLASWGYFGTAEAPEAFWGPRDIAVDASGRVFVSDTGNKRIVVFDSDGNFITQFGSAGLGAGQFDEPVGLAVDKQGIVYVADTWNQRIQTFRELDGQFLPDRSWDIAAWYGQSLENKPFLAVDENGNVFATDPEGYRVLQFDSQGQIVRYWGDFGSGLDSFGMAGSVMVDSQGAVWVSDSGNSRIMRFQLPE